MPLLDWGKNENGLAASKANRTGAVAAYEGTVQEAFREVADALAVRDHIVPELKAQQTLVDQSQRVYTISQVRFKEGMDDYISSQDAQRSLYNDQQKLVSLELDQAVNQVNLYKARVGGWKVGQPANTARLAKAPQQTAVAPPAEDTKRRRLPAPKVRRPRGSSFVSVALFLNRHGFSARLSLPPGSGQNLQE
jgi:hypothetical protein